MIYYTQAMITQNELLLYAQGNKVNTSAHQAKVTSKLKKRYKINETHEQIVELTRLTVPLVVLAMNCLLNGELINETIMQTILAPINLLPLLKIIKGIKKAGYKNKKLVLRLITLVLNPDYKPSFLILEKNIIEAAFLGDKHAVLLLLKNYILSKPSTIIALPSLSKVSSKKKDSSLLKNESTTPAKWTQVLANLITEAFIIATRKNHLKVVKGLLNVIHTHFNHKTIDQILSDGLVHAKSIKMADLYIKKNAAINAKYGPKFANCLGNAVMNDDIELVDYLLINGASPIIPNQNILSLKITPVTFALEGMEKRHPQAKKILIKLAHYSPPKSTNVLMQIILNDLIEDNVKEEATLIVLETNTIDINEKDELGMTALMYAVDKQFYGIVKLLLMYKANVLLSNNAGLSALDLAIFYLEPIAYDWTENQQELEQDKSRRIELAQKIVSLLETSILN